MPSAQATNFDKTVCDNIRDLIAANNSEGIYKQIIYGEPDEEIPIDSFPCIVIHLVKTDIQQETTAHDKLTQEILIRVIINKYGYMDEGSTSDVMTQRELEQRVAGIKNGAYDPASIAGILRTNFTLTNFATDNLLGIQYGQVRDPFANEISEEAQIRAKVESLLLIPQRT